MAGLLETMKAHSPETSVTVSRHGATLKDGVPLLFNAYDMRSGNKILGMAKQRGIPTIIWHHGGGMNEKKSYLFNPKTFEGMSVLATSPRLKRDLESTGVKCLPFIMRPVIQSSRCLPDTSEAAIRARFKLRSVLQISLGPIKGGFFILELAKAMPTVKFLGVTRGNGESAKLSNFEALRGTNDVSTIYERASVVIMPSDPVENFPCVSLESGLSAIPMVASAGCGVTQTLGDAALYGAHPLKGAAGSWVTHLKRLLDDEEYYVATARRCLEAAAATNASAKLDVIEFGKHLASLAP